jgi:nitroreductase
MTAVEAHGGGNGQAPGPELRSVPAGIDPAVVERLLTTTVSVRKRLDLDRPVDRATVEQCLRLAMYAPSANNVQSWRWLVVTDPGMRAEIARYYNLAWQGHGAAIGGSARSRSRDEASSRRRTLQSAQWLADNLGRVPVHVIPCLVGRPPKDSESFAFDRLWQAEVEAVLGPCPERVDPHVSPAGLVRNGMFYGSILPAVWSFQLALRTYGLGSAITMIHLPFQHEVGKLLGLPSIATQICLLPVAYTRGTKFKVPPRRDPAQYIHWNGWAPGDDGARRQGGAP